MSFSRTRFTISMAGLVFDIESPSDRIKNQCTQYLSNESPEIYVKLSKQELDSEINKYVKQGKVNQEKTYYDNDHHTVYILNEINEAVIEANVLYRKIIESILSYDILLMHGAVIARDNEAFMFTARSGTGKTTHIKKWLKNDKSTYVVNGDKPLLKIRDNQVIACGTPWSGKEDMNTNVMIPLKAIVLMIRSENNYFEKIAFSQAYPFLLEQIHIPNDEPKIRMTLDLFQKLNGLVDFYLFHFNNYKDDCFEIAYNMLVN